MLPFFFWELSKSFSRRRGVSISRPWRELKYFSFSSIIFIFKRFFFHRKHKFPVEKVWWSKMRYHLLNDLGLSPNLIFWQWAAAAKHKFLQCQLKLEHLTLRIIFYQGVILEIVINLFSSFWNVITDPRKQCEVTLKWDHQDKS